MTTFARGISVRYNANRRAAVLSIYTTIVWLVITHIIPEIGLAVIRMPL
jgi:hypothetical protein